MLPWTIKPVWGLICDRFTFAMVAGCFWEWAASANGVSNSVAEPEGNAVVGAIHPLAADSRLRSP